MFDRPPITYVIEDPITGNITDMFSFRKVEHPPVHALVTAIVNTKTPAKQLIIDLLLCVKQEQLPRIITFQFGLNSKVFEEVFLVPSYIKVPLYLYNYSYPEVDEDNVVIFRHSV